MTAVVNIAPRDFLRRTLDLWVGDQVDGGVYLIHADGARTYYSNLEPATGPGEPTLRIPEDHARALLQALIRYFDGGEDTRSLRRDYDAERKRVDKLTDVLATIAERGPVVVNA